MRGVKKILFGILLGGLFLLPLFSWIAAEPVPYRDPSGYFSFYPPDGWQVDDSSYIGMGVVAKGPAGAAGVEPAIHLTHEPAGIVTLDVQWHTHLGRLRYELGQVKYLSLEDEEQSRPPYSQADYSYVEGKNVYRALVRLLLHEGRFYLLTASAPEAEFKALRPVFLASFESLTLGKEQ